MIRTQLYQLVFFLLLVFSCVEINAQHSFQRAFKENPYPSKENIRMELVDEQGNQSILPISIIKGKTQGPVFTIVAGVHGFEYPPIIAAQHVIQEIDTDLLTGTLIIIPIANTSSFYSRTPFINPQDKLNLNRSFPGSESGTITEKLAHVISTDIIAVSEVFLDIHGGDANEDLLPFVCYYNNEKYAEQTQKAKALSEVSGFKYIVSYSYTLKDDAPAKYAFKQAVQDGKIALSIECGKLGNVQKEAVDLIKKGIYGMLDEMDMYTSENTDKVQPVRINKQTYIRSEEKGIFYSSYKAGDSVSKGDLLGYTTDEFGTRISEYKATSSGIILYKIGTPPVNTGETVMCIGILP